jgi:hypothetical protein
MARGATQANSTESGAVEVALDEWPLVMFRMPRVVDVNAAHDLGQAINRLLERRERFVMVVDNRRTSDMPPAARKAVATWEKSQDAPLRAYAKAAAIIMPNRAMFAIAGLISWLNPPPYPKKCFLYEAEAKAWARGQLAGGP